MVKTITALKLLDVVTLKQDLPDHDLQAGQVGTIVELLAPEVYEVEFSDDDGQTYAMLPLHSSQLLVAAGTAIGIGVAGVTDFASSAIDLSNKLGVKIELPSAR